MPTAYGCLCTCLATQHHAAAQSCAGLSPVRRCRGRRCMIASSCALNPMSRRRSASSSTSTSTAKGSGEARFTAARTHSAAHIRDRAALQGAPPRPVRRSIVAQRCMMSSKRPGVPTRTWPPLSLKAATSAAASLHAVGAAGLVVVGAVGWGRSAEQGPTSMHHSTDPVVVALSTSTHVPPTRRSARSQGTLATYGCATS